MGAGFRSLILPGWGQISTRHRRLGWALLVTTVLVLVALVAIVSAIGIVEAMAWLADPDVLLAVVAANWLVALVRVTSAGHAWRATGGRHPLAALLLAALVVAPHSVIGWVGLETRQALNEVFVAPLAAPDLTPPEQIAPPITSSSTSTTEVTTMTVSPTTTAPGQYGTDITVPAATPTTVPFNGERINLLLLGGDAGPRRSGLRTDTMIVASIDSASGEVALFGIPRNFGGFTFSDYTPYPGTILNSVYGWGRRHPDAFGGVDPGASATTDVIEHMTGLEIHHFLVIDLTGFAEVVDALGGVNLRVTEPIDGPLYDPITGDYEMIRIPAGDQQLTGGEALAYSRARHGSSDYARMARQRCVLTSLAAQSDAFSLLLRLRELVGVFETHITTDLPVDLIPDLIRLLPRVDPEKVSVIGFDPTWSEGRTPEGYAIPDVERIRSVISETLDEPASVSELGVESAADAC